MKKKGLLYLKMFLIILLSSSTTMCSKKSGDQGSSSESGDKQKFENAEERARKAKEEADATAKAAADAAREAADAAEKLANATIGEAHTKAHEAQQAAKAAKEAADKLTGETGSATGLSEEALAAAKAAITYAQDALTKLQEAIAEAAKMKTDPKAAEEALKKAIDALNKAKEAQDAVQKAKEAGEQLKLEQRRMQPNPINTEVEVPSPNNPDLYHQTMVLNYTKETSTNGVTVEFNMPNATPEILENICKKVTITTEAGYGLVKPKSEFVFVQDDPQQQTQFKCIVDQPAHKVTLSTPPFENTKFRPWVENFHILFDQNTDYQFDVSVKIDPVFETKHKLTRGLISEMVLDETFFGCGLKGTVLQRVFDCLFKVENSAVKIDESNVANSTNVKNKYYTNFDNNKDKNDADNFWFLVSCPAGKKADMEKKDFVPQQSCAWLSPVITPDNPALELEGNASFTEYIHELDFTLQKFQGAYQKRILWGGKLNHNGFGYTFRQANGYDLKNTRIYLTGENPGAGTIPPFDEKKDFVQYSSVCQVQNTNDNLGGFNSGDEGFIKNLLQDVANWILQKSELEWINHISATDLQIRDLISKDSGASSVSWKMPNYPELITLTGGTPVLGKGIDELLKIIVNNKKIKNLVPAQYRKRLEELQQFLQTHPYIKIPTLEDIYTGQRYCQGEGAKKGLAYFCNIKPYKTGTDVNSIEGKDLTEKVVNYMYNQKHFGFNALNVPGFVSTGAYFQEANIDLPTKFPAFPTWPSDAKTSTDWWKFIVTTADVIKQYYSMALNLGEQIAPLLSYQPNNEFLWSSSVGVQGHPNVWTGDNHGFMYVPFGLTEIRTGAEWNNKYPWWGGYVNDTFAPVDFAPIGVRCVSTSWY